MVAVDSAGITDVGMKRKGNEDSLFLDDELGLYVVADGMGGHLAGEVASGLVVDTIRDYMKRLSDDDNAEELEDSDETLSKKANQLLASITLANKGVHQVAKSNKAYRGMGSTVSAACFTDDTLIVANVGDSPIYYVHNGEIELLSVIHSVIAEQEAINPEAAKNIAPQYRHMLTRGMGIEETVQPDVCEIQCFDGDIIILCSDGLTDFLKPKEILEVLVNNRPDKACQKLVDMANERGGDDNITIIVLKVQTEKHLGGGIAGLVSRIFYPFKKIFN